jgi:hypothetical protein
VELDIEYFRDAVFTSAKKPMSFPHLGITTGYSRTAFVVLRDMRCYICRKPVAKASLESLPNGHWTKPVFYTEDNFMFTKDHILPASAGGLGTNQNLAACCSRCNTAKGSLPYRKKAFCIGWFRWWQKSATPDAPRYSHHIVDLRCYATANFSQQLSRGVRKSGTHHFFYFKPNRNEK